MEEIELEDSLKLYASVWEVDDDSKMVLTKDGKVIISKEPLPMLMRLLGIQLDPTIFLLIHCGNFRSLTNAQKLVHQQVLTKIKKTGHI